MLEIAGLTKRYRHNVVLDNVCTVFDEKAIHFIMGPNGSGKSTFLRCVLGLEDFEGSIRWRGRPVDPSARLMFPVFDDPPFYPGLTGRQNLAIAAPESLRSRPAYVDDRLLGTRFDRYSRGQGMRLALSAAMGSGAELVVLDEPANGLDRETMDQLREDLASRRSTTTFVVTGHQLEFYESMVDTVTVVRDGQVDGPTAVGSRGGSLAHTYDASRTTSPN